MACPYYYCKFCGSNCALSMKSHLKSSQMTIPRNGVSTCKSRTSERCKNKIHWDVNVSLIERDREEMGQDKWSELIKWDEMSQPLRHLGVDFISLSPLYGVVSTNQPQVTTVQWWWGRCTTIRKRKKRKKSICSSHQAWTKTTRSPCSELQTADNPSKNTWLI